MKHVTFLKKPVFSVSVQENSLKILNPLGDVLVIRPTIILLSSVYYIWYLSNLVHNFLPHLHQVSAGLPVRLFQKELRIPPSYTDDLWQGSQLFNCSC